MNTIEKRKKAYTKPCLTTYEIGRTQILAGSGDNEDPVDRGDVWY